jgi:hypothetical protein
VTDGNDCLIQAIVLIEPDIGRFSNYGRMVDYPEIRIFGDYFRIGGIAQIRCYGCQ